MKILWWKKRPAAALYPLWHIDMSHGYMKECQQTEADIPPPLWDKRLTNERSCTITARSRFCPRWWSPPWEEGHTKKIKIGSTRTRTPPTTHAVLMDEKWKDINRYADMKGKNNPGADLIHKTTFSFSLTVPTHTQIWGHHSLLAVKCQDKGGDGSMLCTCRQESDWAATMSGKSTNTFVDKPTTSTFNASLTAESVRLWEGVGRVLIENNSILPLTAVLLYFTSEQH